MCTNYAHTTDLGCIGIFLSMNLVGVHNTYTSATLTFLTPQLYKLYISLSHFLATITTLPRQLNFSSCVIWMSPINSSQHWGDSFVDDHTFCFLSYSQYVRFTTRNILIVNEPLFEIENTF